jgi:hypothetical protein
MRQGKQYDPTCATEVPVEDIRTSARKIRAVLDAAVAFCHSANLDDLRRLCESVKAYEEGTP